MIRTKIAGKFGMLEHWMGRFFVGFSIYFYWITRRDDIGLLMILGIIYLVSHHLEKWFYGHHGPRG